MERRINPWNTNSIALSPLATRVFLYGYGDKVLWNVIAGVEGQSDYIGKTITYRSSLRLSREVITASSRYYYEALLDTSESFSGEVLLSKWD